MDVAAAIYLLNEQAGIREHNTTRRRAAAVVSAGRVGVGRVERVQLVCERQQGDVRSRRQLKIINQAARKTHHQIRVWKGERVAHREPSADRVR